MNFAKMTFCPLSSTKMKDFIQQSVLITVYQSYAFFLFLYGLSKTDLNNETDSLFIVKHSVIRNYNTGIFPCWVYKVFKVHKVHKVYKTSFGQNQNGSLRCR